jgi:hypothetical protein
MLTHVEGCTVPQLRDGERKVARSKIRGTVAVKSNKDCANVKVSEKIAPNRMPERNLSADEGVELIRVFLRFEQKEVRSAVIEFITKLSDALTPNGKI